MKYQVKVFKDNKTFTKVIESDNENSLINFLKNEGYFIIDIQSIVSGDIPLISNYFNKVTFDDIVNFTRQLAMILNAGLTLIDALNILKQQTIKKSYRNLLEDIDKEIKSGNSLSNALKKNKNYFSNLYIALVRSGEASGKLNEILLKLADTLESEKEFKSKISSALIYPIIIIVAMIGVMFIMITFVIPKLLGLYKDFNIDLPLTTKILIFISNIMVKMWPLILIMIFGLFISAQRLFKIEAIKYKIDEKFLKIPVFGQIIQKAALVNTTRTLSILIKSGISILDGLRIITDIVDNLVYKKAFEQIYKEVEKGKTLGTALNNAGIFPPILIQMTTVGEETGHLDETYEKISKYFEMESELALKSATALIEPAILVFLGIGVGFLVMSVITPIYNLTTSFK